MAIRSPKWGEARSLSTSASYAFSPSLCLSVSLSFPADGETEGPRDGGTERNASISSGDGGKPSTSNESRRSSVRLSASGDGCSDLASSFDKTKWSIGLTGQPAFFTGGTAGLTGFTYAQCASYSAP